MLLLHLGCSSRVARGSGVGPLQGEGGLTVPGFIGAIGSDCSPIPSRGELLPTKTITQIPLDDPANDHFQLLRPYYLEPVAHTFFPEAISYLPSSVENCGLWAKVGQCKNGHRYARRLFCGRPYHEACREITHRRRLARVLKKAQQMMPMGYWVVRPPNDLQHLLRTRKQRSAFTTRVYRAFKAIGYERGLNLKHDFGDKSHKYAFHLNVLVDSAYKEPSVLDAEKRLLRRLIYPRWVIRQWGDKLDINYHYRQTRAEILHTLKYCTKATFLDIDWDQQLSKLLEGERYVVSWGNWKQPKKWQIPKSDAHLESLVSLEAKKCPSCGEQMTWNEKLVPFVLVLMEDPVDLGNGYYLLPPIRDPPASPGERTI